MTRVQIGIPVAGGLRRGAAWGVRWRLLLPLAACLGVVVFTSCGSKEPDFGADWPVALVEADRGGDAALLEGRLILEGGCIYVEGADGLSWTMPILPWPGTIWDEEAQVLSVRGLPFKVGGPIFLGGGFGSDVANRVVEIDWVRRPHESCDLSDTFWSTDGGDRSASYEGSPVPKYLATEPSELVDTVTGVLIREGDCLLFDEDDGKRFLPAISDSAGLSESLSLTVQITGNRGTSILPVGAHVKLTGRGVRVDEEGHSLDADVWISPWDTDCWSEDVWLVADGEIVAR